jgi:hypothetical protein
MTKIRPAKIEDIDTLIELWWANTLFHAETLGAEGDFVYVEDVLEKMRIHFLKEVIPGENMLVAIHDNKLVGLVEGRQFTKQTRFFISGMFMCFQNFKKWVLEKHL